MGGWISGILQGIFGTMLYDFIFAAVVTAVITYLRATHEKWAGPVLYGFATLVLCFVLGFTIVGHGPLSKQLPETTPQNIETNIKGWVDEFNVGILKQNDASSIFEYIVTLHNGTPVYVTRTHERPGYLQFITKLSVSTQQKQVMASLPTSEQKNIYDEVVLEAAQQRIAYTLDGPPVTTIVLDKAVPITASLTDSTFGDQLDAMDSSVAACRQALRVAIERFKSIPD